MTLSTLCATAHSDPPHLLYVSSAAFSPVPLSFSVSFPLLSVSPVFPGQDPEETLDLDGALALRLDSSIQAWELLQESRRSMVVVVCVCAYFKRGVHVEAVGKHSFDRCC